MDTIDEPMINYITTTTIWDDSGIMYYSPAPSIKNPYLYGHLYLELSDQFATNDEFEMFLRTCLAVAKEMNNA